MKLTWHEVRDLCTQMRQRTALPRIGVYGVPTGGSVVAAMVALEWNVPLLDTPVAGCLVVDDVIDSGTTAQPYLNQGYCFDALCHKWNTPETYRNERVTFDEWVQFPWEADHAPTDAVTRLLEYIGEDPRREGLRDTPQRVIRSLKELTNGYQSNPHDILTARFSSDQYDQMIILRHIPFTSLCEHHLLPFTGTATVAYLPNGHVVGISKLARLVLCFARRLQIQERLTQQIASSLQTIVNPLGVGVIVRAIHACMTCRGVAVQDVQMVTSALTGLFFTNATVRQEFLSLALEK